MDQKNTLRPYIEQQLKAGVQPDAIKQVLLAHSWSEQIVDETLGEIIQPASQPQPMDLPAEVVAELESIRKDTLPERYGIRMAIREAIYAIKHNFKAVAATVAIGLGVSMVATFAAAAILTPLVPRAPRYIGLVEPLGTSNTPIAIIIAASIGFGVIQLLLSAYLQSVILLSINAGAEKSKTSIRSMFALGLGRFLRFVVASWFYGLLLATPIMLGFIIGMLISLLSKDLEWAIPVLITVGAVCTIPLAVRFIIMPYVALFEKELPLRKLFSRTKFLMKGAFGFVAKLLVLLAVIYALVSIATQYIDPAAGSALILVSLPSVIIWGILSLMMNAVLIVFYRNRKMIKG